MEKKRTKKNETKNSLLKVLFLCFLILFTPIFSDANVNLQQIEFRVIVGRVISTKQEPLQGATVKLPKTHTGAIADAKGNFSLNVPSNTRTLEVSCMGYTTKQVEIKGPGPVTVMLEVVTAEVDEVVVTGFFDRRKEGFAGSVTTIRKADLQKFSTGNIFTTIANLDPGFRIIDDIKAGSNPNILPDFLIRSKGSFQKGSTIPLFILDGFEVTAEKVFDMDINRIGTITLLKDASATILYGSRAANGVVVIETIPPAAGAINVTYDFKPTVSFADLTGYDLMNAREKLEYEVLAGLYDPDTEDQSEIIRAKEEYYRRYKNVAEGVDTYWLSQPVRNTLSQDHSLGIEGGVESVVYGINLFYRNQNGVMKGSGRDRIGGDFTLRYRIRDKIIVRNVVSYAHVHAYNSPYGSYSRYGTLNPYNRIHDDEGKLLPLLINDAPNPIFNAFLPYRNYTKSQEFREQLHLEWIIGPHLKLRGNCGILKSNMEKLYYASPFNSKFMKWEYNFTTGRYECIYLPMEERGELTYGTKNNLRVEGDVTLNYNKLFGEKHLFYAGVGTQLNTSDDRSISFSMIGFPDDRFIDAAFAMKYKENTKPVSREERTRSVGFFGNANYLYDNRYFVDLSVRYDGSSQFGSENKFAPFFSLGGGWNIHNESFFGENSIIDLLKLRISYGTSGNQAFDSWQAKTMYEFMTDRTYDKLLTVALVGYGNPYLKWQKLYQTNIGLDFGLMQRRLTITFNHYWKRTEDTLTDITVAPQLGFPGNTYKSNLGKISNVGYEVSLNGVIIRNQARELEWAVMLQAAHNRNKLLEISNSLKKLNDFHGGQTLPGNVYEEGHSMTAIKAVRSLGIDPVTGRELYVRKDGTLTYEWNAEDKVHCGDTEPEVFGNIGTNVYFKRWNLNVSCRYSLGGYIYNQTLAGRVEGVDPQNNADRRVLKDRWKKPGDHALYRNINDFKSSFVSSRFVQKENMLNVNSISLSYTFDTEFLRKRKINTLRLSFFMNNPVRLSTIKQERGLEYPFERSYVFGLNINF